MISLIVCILFSRLLARDVIACKTLLLILWLRSLPYILKLIRLNIVHVNLLRELVTLSRVLVIDSVSEEGDSRLASRLCRLADLSRVVTRCLVAMLAFDMMNFVKEIL